MVNTGKFHILYDSDAGSSGKGAAITRLAAILGYQNFSCNHGPNAGHFVERDDDGQRLLMKILPSPAALRWVAGLPATEHHRLFIGPNSAFEVRQLFSELSATGYSPQRDCFIHGRAAITEQQHKDAEAPGGIMSTLHVSSTMSGAGATYAGKAMRQVSTLLAEEIGGLYTLPARAFFQQVRDELRERHDFLHEVAQGFALSLDYGIQTRHGTYRNPTALQAAADMGITPDLVGNVYANLRTFPIRVGNNFDKDGKQVGYSGDWYPDQVELDWRTIGFNAGMPEEEILRLYDKELTSVTKKLRRVASFSMESLRYSTAFNGADRLILNFTSYLDWASTDRQGGRKEYLALGLKVRGFVEAIENEVGIPVVMLGTGAKHSSYILPYNDLNVHFPPSTQRSIADAAEIARFDAQNAIDSGS